MKIAYQNVGLLVLFLAVPVLADERIDHAAATEATAEEASTKNYVIIDPNAFSLSGTINNSGDERTGNYRLTLIGSNYNLFDLGHNIYAGWYTSPTEIDDLNTFFGGYDAPFNKGRDTISVSGYYANQGFDSRVEFGEDPFTGVFDGWSAALSYKRVLPGSLVATEKHFQHTALIGFEAQRSRTSQEFLSQRTESNLTIAPVSLGYEVLAGWQQISLSGFLRYLHNLNIGPFNNAFEFADNRPGAETDFDVLRGSVALESSFAGRWFFSFETFWQYGGEPLIGPMQMALGGINGIRVVDPSEAFGDNGVLGTVQVVTPQLLANTPLRSFIATYIDAGFVEEEEEHETTGVSSVSAVGLGIGWRWRRYSWIEADADVTYLIGGSLVDQDRRETSERFRVLFSIMARY
jgi:hemolysin activation/secretion protein